MDATLVRNPDVIAGRNVTTKGRRAYFYRRGDLQLTDIGWPEAADFSNDPETRAFTGNRDGRDVKVKEVVTGVTRTATIQTASTGDRAVKELYLGTRLIAGSELATEAFAPTSAVAVGDSILANGYVYQVTTAGTTGETEPTWSQALGTLTTSGTATFRNIGTTDANRVYGAEDTLGTTDVGMIYVQSTELSDGLDGNTIVRIYPHANVRGNGEPTIQDFDGYELEVSILANQGFTPPANIVNFGQSKADGFLYIVPNSRLDEVEDALGAALIAYTDGQSA